MEFATRGLGSAVCFTCLGSNSSAAQFRHIFLTSQCLQEAESGTVSLSNIDKASLIFLSWWGADRSDDLLLRCHLQVWLNYSPWLSWYLQQIYLPPEAAGKFYHFTLSCITVNFCRQIIDFSVWGFKRWPWRCFFFFNTIFLQSDYLYLHDYTLKGNLFIYSVRRNGREKIASQISWTTFAPEVRKVIDVFELFLFATLKVVFVLLCVILAIT